MARKKAKAKRSAGSLDVPGIVLSNNPQVYMAAIRGRWLLDHSTPSWRILAPKKGFQRIVKEQRAKEIAKTVLDTERTLPDRKSVV